VENDALILESIFDLLLALNSISIGFQLSLTLFNPVPWPLNQKCRRTGCRSAAVMLSSAVSTSVGLFSFVLDFARFVLPTCQDGVLVEQCGSLYTVEKQEAVHMVGNWRSSFAER